MPHWRCCPAASFFLYSFRRSFEIVTNGWSFPNRERQARASGEENGGVLSKKPAHHECRKARQELRSARVCHAHRPPTLVIQGYNRRVETTPPDRRAPFRMFIVVRNAAGTCLNFQPTGSLQFAAVFFLTDPSDGREARATIISVQNLIKNLLAHYLLLCKGHRKMVAFRHPLLPKV